MFAGPLAFAPWALIGVGAFLVGYWLSVVVPLAALLPVTIAFGAAQQALERYSADRSSGIVREREAGQPRGRYSQSRAAFARQNVAVSLRVAGTRKSSGQRFPR
jgi:hypothetical protein